MHTCKAVLFDLDGTLLDTLDDLADSMNAVLRQMGHPTHATDCYRTFVGDGVETLARRVLPQEVQDPETVERCVQGMLTEYGRRWADTTRPYPGITELLEGLAAKEIKSVILSNKPDEFTQKAVGRFLGNHHFDLVVGVRPGIAKKPDPAAALAMAQKLGLEPADFFYLGDTNTDMQTAIRAGMSPVAVLWGFRDESELRQAGAKLFLSHPSQLFDHI